MPSDVPDDRRTQQRPALKFADEHIKAILRGQKTVTYRHRDAIEYEEFEIGRRIHLLDEHGERFASATISDRGYTTAEMLATMDVDGHRSYQDVDELLSELSRYYPDRELGPNTCLELIYWEEMWE